jgi:HSP90 family molecular chaperone
MGYGSFDAVMDLIDNSIDAKASAVSVQIKELGKGQHRHRHLPTTARAWTRRRLAEALRLGSHTKHDEKKDLGKYGMGLVTASISVARRVTMLTRQEGKQAFEADFNLDTIARRTASSSRWSRPSPTVRRCWT